MFSAMTLVARSSRLVARYAGFAIVVAGASVATAATCDSLKTITLPDATVDSVQIVAAGTFHCGVQRGIETSPGPSAAVRGGWVTSRSS